MRTHGGAPGYVPEWNPQEQGSNPVNELDGVNVLNLYRLDQSYPAFGNASANHEPGNGLAGDGDSVGTINGHLRWERATIVDTPARWEMTIRLQDLVTEPAMGMQVTVPAPPSATVDVTPRRLQRFAVVPFASYAYANLDASSNVVASGVVTADALGLVTVPGFAVSSGGNRLVLTARDALFGDGFE